MKFLTISILFIFGILNFFNSNDVPQILDEYMEWTQTGKACLSNALFDANLNSLIKPDQVNSNLALFFNT